MKQFGHVTSGDRKSQRSWTDANTCHVGVRIQGKFREVYRIELLNEIGKTARGMVYVSDMLDEGHFFQPTVERKPANTKPKTVIIQLAKKYEKLARKQLGVK